MLKRIIHPSELFVSFIVALHLSLSKPQREHLVRTADAIIVCEERKTLSALYRQWVDAPDVSAVANCVRAGTGWRPAQTETPRGLSYVVTGAVFVVGGQDFVPAAQAQGAGDQVHPEGGVGDEGEVISFR